MLYSPRGCIYRGVARNTARKSDVMKLLPRSVLRPIVMECLHIRYHPESGSGSVSRGRPKSAGQKQTHSVTSYKRVNGAGLTDREEKRRRLHPVPWPAGGTTYNVSAKTA